MTIFSKGWIAKAFFVQAQSVSLSKRKWRFVLPLTLHLRLAWTWCLLFDGSAHIHELSLRWLRYPSSITGRSWQVLQFTCFLSSVRSFSFLLQFGLWNGYWFLHIFFGTLQVTHAFQMFDLCWIAKVRHKLNLFSRETCSSS